MYNFSVWILYLKKQGKKLYLKVKTVTKCLIFENISALNIIYVASFLILVMQIYK